MGLEQRSECNRVGVVLLFRERTFQDRHALRVRKEARGWSV